MSRLLLALVLLLGACAAPSGNSRGGVFPAVGMSPGLAQERADMHCAKYGKLARITSYEQKASGNVLFDCK